MRRGSPGPNVSCRAASTHGCARFVGGCATPLHGRSRQWRLRRRRRRRRATSTSSSPTARHSSVTHPDVRDAPREAVGEGTTFGARRRARSCSPKMTARRARTGSTGLVGHRSVDERGATRARLTGRDKIVSRRLLPRHSTRSWWRVGAASLRWDCPVRPASRGVPVATPSSPPTTKCRRGSPRRGGVGGSRSRRT